MMDVWISNAPTLYLKKYINLSTDLLKIYQVPRFIKYHVNVFSLNVYLSL